MKENPNEDQVKFTMQLFNALVIGTALYGFSHDPLSNGCEIAIATINILALQKKASPAYAIAAYVSNHLQVGLGFFNSIESPSLKSAKDLAVGFANLAQPVLVEALDRKTTLNL